MRSLRLMLLIAAAQFPSQALADIYKCQDDDGNKVFQQTPCAKKESIKVDAASPSSSDADCTFANRFAVTAARFMRAGVRSDQLFERYGGLDSLSKGSLGVINYVYSFRSSDGVSVERLGSLTQAKCRARSLGDVSCEALPLSFTEGLGGCNASDEERRVAEARQKTEFAQMSAQPVNQAVPRSSETSAMSAKIVAQCKKKNRDAIDAIDAEMRQGYSSEQGEIYKQRLRVLTKQLRGC